MAFVDQCTCQTLVLLSPNASWQYCFLQFNRILAVSETMVAPPPKFGAGTTRNKYITNNLAIIIEITKKSIEGVYNLIGGLRSNLV